MAGNNITPRDLTMMQIACSIKPNYPEKMVRAVIANKDGRIISWGNTDRVKGCPFDESRGSSANWKYSVHAEVYAIIRSIDPKGCTIYVTAKPCNECAKLIIHSGITRVVYRDGKIDEGNNIYWDISLDILKDAQVLYKAIQPEDKKIKPLSDFNADNVVGIIVDLEGNIEYPDEPEENLPEGNNAMQPRGEEDRDFDLANMREAEEIANHNETRDLPVGALIVDSMGNIVSSGYPRMPRGCQREGSNDALPCGAADKYAIHAVDDAIFGNNAAWNNVRGCTLYLTKYPCNASARMISVTGISRLVTKSQKSGHADCAVEDILNRANVKITFLEATD